MVTKKLIARTRPFQALFAAADDLRGLAYPYYQLVEASKQKFKGTEIADPVNRDDWRREKSLAIGAFTIMYAAIEGLVNCAFNDFGIRQVSDLPEFCFKNELENRKKALRNKDFGWWHLATRVFLLPPLCSDPIIDPCQVFDINSAEWKKFIEIIEIRHSFNHACEQQLPISATKAGPNFWLVDDSHPDNSWPMTGTPRDHRVFGYESASTLNFGLEFILEKLREAMPNQLNDDYMTKESWKILES
jgi:hypothetical protein